MTINWRKTAGGVEIAEHEGMTCIVWGHGGVVVARNGDNSAQVLNCVRDWGRCDGSSTENTEEANEWLADARRCRLLRATDDLGEPVRDSGGVSALDESQHLLRHLLQRFHASSAAKECD